jgi:hypothetical protein
MRSVVADIRSDFRQQRERLEALTVEVAEMRGEMTVLRADVQALRADLFAFRGSVEARFDSQSLQLVQSTRWSVGVLALFGTVFSIVIGAQTLLP